MIGTTAIDVAVKLREMFKAVVPEGVPVLFGSAIPESGTVYVCVAYGGDDRPGIAGGGQINRYANPGDAGAEAYTVWCMVEAGSGDQDTNAMIAIMDRVQVIYGACAVAVRQDNKLGGAIGAIGSAEVGPFEWSLDTEGATTATIFFGIVVTQGWL